MGQRGSCVYGVHPPTILSSNTGKDSSRHPYTAEKSRRRNEDSAENFPASPQPKMRSAEPAHRSYIVHLEMKAVKPAKVHPLTQNPFFQSSS